MEYFKGMKIVCINDKNTLNREEGFLVKGKEYVIEDWTNSSIKVEGLNQYWSNTRFELSINNTTINMEEKLLEKISKLTEKKVKLESMEKITERKMIDLIDKRRSVDDELKRTMTEYCDIITKKLEENV